MQIEETFRDTKNPRLGWALDFSGTKSPERMEALFLLAAMAVLAVVIAGLSAEDAALKRHFQANTTRSRRVLSVFTLGTLVLRSERPLIRPSWTALHRQLAVVPEHFTKFHRAYKGFPPHNLYCADCGDHFTEYGWPPI